MENPNTQTVIEKTAEMTGEELAAQLTRQSKTGLRPCPFCNSISLSLITLADEVPLTIECNECGATGPNDEGDRENPDRDKRLRVLWDTRRETI